MRRRKWSRVLGVGIAAVAVAALSFAVMPTGPPDNPDPPGCFVPPPPPTPLPEESGDDAPVVRQANALARAGELSLAEPLYESLGEDDVRRTGGLLYVQAGRDAAERVAASAQRMVTAEDAGADACFQSALAIDSDNEAARTALTLDTRSLPMRAADRWDIFASRSLRPLGTLLIPAVAALAVLLVVGRYLVPRTAPPQAEAWPPWATRTAWWSGLALLAVAVVRTVVLLGWPATRAADVDDDVRRVLVALLIALVVVFLIVGRRLRALRRIRADSGVPALAGLLGLGVLLVAGASAVLVRLLLALWDVGPGRESVSPVVWPWLTTAAVAALGLVLHSVGRGHALRLQVTVKKGDAVDPAGTAYVLASLEQLGTSPPEGLKAPQQVDVTELPADALTALPAGKFAAALTAALGLLRASVPWRATVADTGEDRMIVTVTRNGDVVRTAIIDGERFREPTTRRTDEKPAEDPTRDARNLLTAAAAVILTELAVRNPSLGRGLCGATQWDSVAAHVVATRRTGPLGDDRFQRRLLAFAVQRDPRNALARAAYTQRLGEVAASAREFCAQVERLRALQETVDHQRRFPCDPETGDVEPVRGPLDDDDGYLPLRIRTQHALTAALLNAAVADGLPSDVEEARAALAEFEDMLRVCADRGRFDSFVAESRTVAEELAVALTVIEPSRTDTAFPGAKTWWRPRSLRALYDRACALTVDAHRPGPLRAQARDGRRHLAFEDLRLATDIPELEEQAWRDPWLRHLRDGTDDPSTPATFRSIVAATGPGESSAAPGGH